MDRCRNGPGFHGDGEGGASVQEMLIPASKVGLVIGRGGDTIKQLQVRCLTDNTRTIQFSRTPAGVSVPLSISDVHCCCVPGASRSKDDDDPGRPDANRSRQTPSYLWRPVQSAGTRFTPDMRGPSLVSLLEFSPIGGCSFQMNWPEQFLLHHQGAFTDSFIADLVPLSLDSQTYQDAIKLLCM